MLEATNNTMGSDFMGDNEKCPCISVSALEDRVVRVEDRVEEIRNRMEVDGKLLTRIDTKMNMLIAGFLLVAGPAAAVIVGYIAGGK